MSKYNKGGNMNTCKISVCLQIICLLFFVLPAHAAERTPLKGESFPDISLQVPEKTSEKEYLGLTGKGSFQISRIKTDIVILEIFSMYCPYCQKEAPLVNELYQAIMKREDLKNRIKIMGVGAGNTPFEVDVFKNQYNIQFPLLSDEAFTVHKKVGEVRTPYFFVFKQNADGSNKIIYSRVGSIQDPHQFLEEIILKESGVK
jgi:peroxiredoxin